MHFSSRTLLTGAFAFVVSTAAQKSTGQACPSGAVDVFDSCVCPHGTDYSISTTYATLGVNAKDFYSYTASFYNLAWQGLTNLTRNGPDYTVGSTRTFVSPTGQGTLTFTEKLDVFKTASDGSYYARFSQFNVPIAYQNGQNGSFAGYWIDFDAEWASEYETVLKWTNYACATGHPFDYGKYHVAAIKGLLNTMGKAGLVKGNTTGPFVKQDF